MAKQPEAEAAARRIRGSRTGRPIMVLLDLLGRRWTLRVLWELRDGPLTARALRAACDEASPTVLQARLGDLRQGRLVEHAAGQGYGLTAEGRDLLATFLPLYGFAERWAGGSAGASDVDEEVPGDKPATPG